MFPKVGIRPPTGIFECEEVAKFTKKKQGFKYLPTDCNHLSRSQTEWQIGKQKPQTIAEIVLSATLDMLNISVGKSKGK